MVMHWTNLMGQRRVKEEKEKKQKGEGELLWKIWIGERKRGKTEKQLRVKERHLSNFFGLFR